MEIITRRQAIEGALSRYYTGKPCRYGHLSQRYTTTGACLECARIYRAEDKKRIKERRGDMAEVRAKAQAECDKKESK